MVCSKNFNALASSRITIQLDSVSDTAYGGQSRTWVNESIVWGIMNPRSGREFLKGDQRDNSVNNIIIIRYQPALKSALQAARRRIKYDDRYFNILSVQNVKDFETSNKIEGKNFQILTCEEVKQEVA